jgi:hypothetical protein
LNWDRQTAHSFSSSSGPPADVRHGSRSTIDVGALPSLSRESSSCSNRLLQFQPQAHRNQFDDDWILLNYG